jgi:hypothetical protein
LSFAMRLPGLQETAIANTSGSKNRYMDRSMFICRIRP